MIIIVLPQIGSITSQDPSDRHFATDDPDIELPTPQVKVAIVTEPLVVMETEPFIGIV